MLNVCVGVLHVNVEEAPKVKPIIIVASRMIFTMHRNGHIKSVTKQPNPQETFLTMVCKYDLLYYSAGNRLSPSMLSFFLVWLCVVFLFSFQK